MFRRSILAAVLLAGTALTALPAKADLVISDFIFADLGGTGFGVAPRLLTLQTNTFESGGTVAGAGGTTTLTGGAISGADKSLVYSLSALGWTSGAQVGIGLDTSEVGSGQGLTWDTLVLTLYSSTGSVLGTFSGNGPVNISEALLSQQAGNGNSVFNVGLSASQQITFNQILAANGGAANIFEGLSASFGCPSSITPCFPSSDGPESFLGFQQSAVAVPGPIVGAGIPGLISACFGMIGLNTWRRRRRVVS